MLAISAGRTVSTDRLIEALWDGGLPDNAVRSVQTYVARLRSALGVEAIGSERNGYVLRVEPDQVDVCRFLRLLDVAAASRDPAAERNALADALGLWRSTPYADIRSAWLDRNESPRLHERYLTAVQRRIDLDIAAGRGHSLVAELSEVTARNPLHEPLWARLLVVLNHCGRQSEALQRYETIRVRLAEELGTDPGPELRRIHAELLTRTTSAPGSEEAPGIRRPLVRQRPLFAAPRQLPPSPAESLFTGRSRELKQLTENLNNGTVSVISGMAGVGKTWLALRWAHLNQDRFPDGQLYVNMQGFAPATVPKTPITAVRGFLDALGVDPGAIPIETDAQAALFRSLVADKRMLILLDNVRDTADVIPVLPSSPHCTVLITSRHPLAGLVTAHNARPVFLDILTDHEARSLMVRHLGQARVFAETAAVAELLEKCRGLPLALAIVAARAAIHQDLPLATFAMELRDEPSRLSALSTGDDPETDVRTVFSWSYRGLSTSAAQVFRLLGWHPGPDIGIGAVACLAGLELTATKRALDELTRARLVTRRRPDRIALHDLLSLYARELTETADHEAERRAATNRMLDHYLHTAHAAARLLSPHRDLPSLPSPSPGATPEEFAVHDAALAWFEAEQPVLLAVFHHAASTHRDAFLAPLASIMEAFLGRRGLWNDQVAIQRAVLTSTQRRADRLGEARTLRVLGSTYGQLNQFEQAHLQYQQALDLYHDLNEPVGLGHTHRGLAWLFHRQGRYRKALPHAEQALALYQTSGHHRAGQARALYLLGWCHTWLGNYQQALVACKKALNYCARDDLYAKASSLGIMGHAHHQLRNYQRALSYYQSALTLVRQLDDRYGLVLLQNHIGDTYSAIGDGETARDRWQHALATLHQLGQSEHAEAERIRAKLHGLDARGDRLPPDIGHLSTAARHNSG